jgi:hypothetical protein
MGRTRSLIDVGDTLHLKYGRRYKANLERLNSRDRSKIAGMVRELSTLDRDHGLSTGEQRMLWRAWWLLRDLPDQGGQTGVREPRGPLPPTDAGSTAIDLPGEPERN